MSQKLREFYVHLSRNILFTTNHTKKMSLSELFKKIFSRLFVGNCLGMLILTVLLGAATYIFIGYYTHHGEEITVPDVCGLDENVAKKRSNKVMQSAKDNGAEMVITACPLCMYNLKKNGGVEDVPVVYFTELLAEALDLK